MSGGTGNVWILKDSQLNNNRIIVFAVCHDKDRLLCVITSNFQTRYEDREIE